MKSFRNALMLLAAATVFSAVSTAQAVVINFGDTGMGNETALGTAYQPVAGVTINWGGFTYYNNRAYHEGEGALNIGFSTDVYVDSLVMDAYSWGPGFTSLSVGGYDASNNQVWVANYDASNTNGQTLAGSAVSGIRSLRFSGDANLGTSWGFEIDDVSVSPVPEPVSMALLAIPALVLMRRRFA